MMTRSVAYATKKSTRRYPTPAAKRSSSSSLMTLTRSPGPSAQRDDGEPDEKRREPGSPFDGPELPQRCCQEKQRHAECQQAKVDRATAGGRAVHRKILPLLRRISR